MNSNTKNIIVSSVFVIIGIAAMLFMFLVVFPANEYNSKVCTKEVEAVVVGNEAFWQSTGDGDSTRRYKQNLEYEIDGTIYKLSYQVKVTPDPIPEGTKITIWVDPDHPSRFTNTLDTSIGGYLLQLICPICFILFGALGIVNNVKKNKESAPKKEETK